MSFATRIAETSPPKPVYILEFDGDQVDSAEFDSVANWVGSADVSNLDLCTTDAIKGTASIEWDKTGTASQHGAIANASFSFADTLGRYYTIKFKRPATTAGTPEFLIVGIGDDISNAYFWYVPAAFFTEGEWTTVHMSTSVLSSEYNQRLLTGSPSSTHTYIYINWRGTDSSFTYANARVDALLYHPYRYAHGRVADPIADTKQGWMQPPNVTGNRYDILSAKMSTAAAQCKVVDDDDSTVITDINDFAMLRRVANVKMGFSGDSETETNYEKIFRGIVDRAPHSCKTWTFICGDLQRKLKVPFAQDATEDSPYTISGNILTVFLKLALSTGNGNNQGDFSANYDTETAGNGAGIPAELISTDIETIRDDWMPLDTCSFTFTEPEPDLLDWYNTEVCKAFGVMSVLTSDGKLSLQPVQKAVYPIASPAAFDTTNIISAKQVDFTLDSERTRNQVRYLYQWDATNEKFDADSVDTYQLADSIARYGLKELKIESKGITSATVAARAARRWLYILGEGSPPVELQTIHTEQPRVLGELVELTIPRIYPDIDSTAYGIDGKLAQIDGGSFNPATSSCDYKLVQTSYRIGNYRLISNIAVDYDSHTVAQKSKYACIADGSDQLGAANDDAHEIGP